MYKKHFTKRGMNENVKSFKELIKTKIIKNAKLSS